MNSIENTLEYLIKGIVADPSQISIETVQTDDTLTLNIISPSEITGQLIGKQGKIIKAIRTILTITYPEQKFLLEFKN